ncbi:hypothetical protein Tco_1516431 [Tanacetum coccineum]
MLAPESTIQVKWTEKTVPVAEGSSETTTEGYMENYKNVSQYIQDKLNAEAEVVQVILTGIDNDIYSTVNACPNACEMWKGIKRLKQGELINVQDIGTNLYWEFGKFTSHDGESLESYYSIMAKFVTLVTTSLPYLEAILLTTTQNSSPDQHKASTRNRGKAIINSLSPIYDQELDMVTKDDALSKEKEIDKLMALISLSFK